MSLETTRQPTGKRGVMLRRAGAVFAVGVSVAIGAACSRQPREGAEASSGAVAPAGLLRPAAAAEVKAAVSAARGKVVVVNVWATWCEPCREEFPDLLRLRREHGPRGMELILVSADFERQASAAEAFLREQGVDFPSYLKSGRDMEFIEGLEPRWSGSLPATFVHDRQGRLVEFWEGMASYETLVGKVTPLL